MVRARLRGVGYCARMTEVGDWAFQFALELARRHGTPLNIFYFPCSPYEVHASRGHSGRRFRLTRQQEIDLERQVRFYYEPRLADFVDVGFRLCPGDESPEMRRCLFHREYDILVLAYEQRQCLFGQRPIEDFAEHMPCPIVLVGPTRPDELYLNTPAKLWTAELGLGKTDWKLVAAATA